VQSYGSGLVEVAAMLEIIINPKKNGEQG